MFLIFFFQAEDGIRDWSVTGVQTCALPIFEGVGRERRAEPAEAPREFPQDGVAAGPSVERPELELEPEQLFDDRPRLGVERLDGDAARGRSDAHLAAADDTMDAAVVPQVREIGPEGAEALGRTLEVVRLGHGQ